MILSIIGIVLGLTSIGLFFWLKNDQKMSNDLHEAELNHTHQGMNAVMNDFNNYQVETNRKIAELEKQLEIKTKQQDKNLVKLRKELPSIIGQVVGQIELAQDRIKRQM
tara:strand:- start:158 stop:484 length:327 start_codon:yes stop_codon:yes gene_type:complete